MFPNKTAPKKWFNVNWEISIPQLKFSFHTSDTPQPIELIEYWRLGPIYLSKTTYFHWSSNPTKALLWIGSTERPLSAPLPSFNDTCLLSSGKRKVETTKIAPFRFYNVTYYLTWIDRSKFELFQFPNFANLFYYIFILTNVRYPLLYTNSFDNHQAPSTRKALSVKTSKSFKLMAFSDFPRIQNLIEII